MDGMLYFAVCISSWSLVLATGLMGREIADNKLQKWDQWNDDMKQVYSGSSGSRCVC